MGFFNFTTVSFIVAAAYLYFTAQKLYQMMNPLDGIEVSGPTIDPQWKSNQSFSLLSFISTSPKFSTIKLSKLKSSGVILFSRNDLTFSDAQSEITMHFNVTAERRRKNSSSSATESNIVATSATTGSEDFPTISIGSSKVWSELRSNGSSVYLHILVTKDPRDRTGSRTVTPTEDNGDNELDEITSTMISKGEALYSVVSLVKFDKIPKQFRQRYLLSDFGLVSVTPAEEEKLKLSPETIISYWKPEVAVRLVTDFSIYPLHYVPESIQRNVVRPSSSSSGSSRSRQQQQQQQQQQLYYKPPIHADEIGLTSDKYIPLNDSVSSLPLKISYGSMSLQRWLLMQNMEESLQAQSSFGFSDKDIDDVRRLISDTSVYLLGVTMIASLLHLLFEFLAFRSDISFWQNNKSLAGLSVRSVVTEVFSQIIVFLFLIDSDTSLLVTIPAFFGIGIQFWKVQKATGLKVVRSKSPSLLGYTIVCTRLMDDPEDTEEEEGEDTKEEEEREDSNEGEKETKKGNKKDKKQSSSSSSSTSASVSIEELTRVTLEADRVATYHLGTVLFPLAIGFTVRSLLVEKHLTWYSWGIGALTGCVYTFGFILMCPQLFINHKLKSVSHLPWNFLIFRFLNTFIDDLFAFIIKMPTMHRLSVFRDDIVFLIYIYQRWIYRVDMSRPIEK